MIRYAILLGMIVFNLGHLNYAADLIDSKDQTPTTRSIMKEDVFKKGYFFFSKEFNFSYAPTILHTSVGSNSLQIVAWAGRRKSNDQDGVWFTYKSVNSKDWQDPEEVINTQKLEELGWKPLPGNSPKCWEPVLDKIGEEVHLYFKVGSLPGEWTSFKMLASILNDNPVKINWSQPEILEHAKGPTKGRSVIVGSNIVYPSSRETTYRDSCVFEIFNKETGEWKTTNAVQPKDSKLLSAESSCRGFITPILLPGGNSRNELMALVRPRDKTQQQETEFPIFMTYSHDGGLTWEPLQATSLKNRDSAFYAVGR